QRGGPLQRRCPPPTPPPRGRGGECHLPVDSPHSSSPACSGGPPFFGIDWLRCPAGPRAQSGGTVEEKGGVGGWESRGEPRLEPGSRFFEASTGFGIQRDPGSSPG